MVDIGIQWIAFLFANYFKTEKFYDLTGEIDVVLPSALLCFAIPFNVKVVRGTN